MKIVKIGAIWCPGCIIMRPRMKEIEEEYPEITSIYYDFDDHEEYLVQQYNIKDTLPVFIFLDQNDKELTRLIGEVSRNEIIKTIEKFKNM